MSRLVPLNWLGPAISLVLQLLALLSSLYVILGWRPVLLVPLTFALVFHMSFCEPSQLISKRI
jgi:hypothetical protein